MNTDPNSEDAGIRKVLYALLDFRLDAWRGLPAWSLADVTAALGEPADRTEAMLGMYPALRQSHALPGCAAGGLMVFSRQSRVVLIETFSAPPIEVLARLGEPDARLPHELNAADAYVWELVFCQRGLVLSVAEMFDSSRPAAVVRCRGLRVLARPEDYGAELYLPLESRTGWSEP